MTKLRYRFFSFFSILNTYVSLIFHAKIQPKIFSGSGEVISLVLLFLVTAAILDIRPDPILQF